MDICRTTKQEVRQTGFKPEKHTVAFIGDGDWYCVKDNGRIVACLCMCDKNYGIQMDELYTHPDYRGRGIMSQLIKYVCDEIYAGKKITAHCLKSSKNIVEKAGFRLKNIVEFKYGTQWRFVRDGEPGKVRRWSDG